MSPLGAKPRPLGAGGGGGGYAPRPRGASKDARGPLGTPLPLTGGRSRAPSGRGAYSSLRLVGALLYDPLGCLSPPYRTGDLPRGANR